VSGGSWEREGCLWSAAFALMRRVGDTTCHDDGNCIIVAMEKWLCESSFGGKTDLGCHFSRVVSIRYFRSVFGRYFSVFTIPIPKENSVGTFRYQKGEKGGDRYRPKYRKSSKSDTGKIPIPKKLPVTPRYTTLHFSPCSRTRHPRQRATTSLKLGVSDINVAKY